MSVALAQEPLRICTGQSRAEQVVLPASAEAISSELARRDLQEATVILWQVNCIRCGIWKNGAFAFSDGAALDAALLIELRVFDAACELYLLREGTELFGRFRQDGMGEAAEYVDSIARFWGKRTDEGAWMTLCDHARKLSLTLPALPESSRYVGLVTRSYIGIHEKTAQAGYTDMRYLSIASADIKGEE